ncbi:MAG: acyltransferase family protein [Acidimicrobiia bacterium]|nr:MAG: acyltransferase family protein [Acidimicrobiia bacterium]
MLGLDGLRAIAVMAVVFYHADFSWAAGGFLGVEVFFVISGYLITSLLLVEWLRTGTIGLKNFWLRRARRLLPALFALLAAVSIASILFYRDTVARMLGDVVSATTYVTNWFFILRQDSYFEAFGRPPLLKHLWSLGVEEQFYVLWPLIFTFGLAMLGRGSQKRTLKRFGALVLTGILASTALMVLLYTPYEDPSRVYYGTDTRATGILIGVLLALVWMPWRLPTKLVGLQRISINTTGVVALGLMVLILVNLNEFTPNLYRGGFLVTSLITAAAIAAAVHPGSSLGAILDNPVMKWLGTRSYGIYLWHYPIFMVTRPGFDVSWGVAPTFAVRLALTFAVTELSYRFVESPIRRNGFRAWMASIRRRLGIRSVQTATGFALIILATFLLIGAGLVQGATESVRSTSVVASPDDDGTEIVIVDLGPFRTSTTTTTTTTTLFKETLIEASAAEPEPTPTVTTTTTETTALPSVTMIGDSVMLGAEGALFATLPNELNFEASVSRQFMQVSDVVAQLRSRDELGQIVVIHLGTNGVFSSDMFDRVMTELSDRDRVIVVNAKVPRRWETLVNDAIAQGAQRWPEVEVVDWNSYGAQNPQFFTEDKVHLNPEGQAAYAKLLDRAINGTQDSVPDSVRRYRAIAGTR